MWKIGMLSLVMLAGAWWLHSTSGAIEQESFNPVKLKPSGRQHLQFQGCRPAVSRLTLCFRQLRRKWLFDTSSGFVIELSPHIYTNAVTGLPVDDRCYIGGAGPVENQDWGWSFNLGKTKVQFASSVKESLNLARDDRNLPANDVTEELPVDGHKVPCKGVEAVIPVEFRRTVSTKLHLEREGRILLDRCSPSKSDLVGKIHLKLFPDTRYFYVKFHFDGSSYGPGWCDAPVEEGGGQFQRDFRHNEIPLQYEIHWGQ